MDQEQLEDLKRGLCRAADEELMTRFNRVATLHKTDGSVVTEADLAMQGRMQRELGAMFPGFGFLGEEMSPDQCQAQLDGSPDGLWVLDPVDGTSNFAAGIPYFAVSLALLVDRRVRLALVYDPARKELFHAVAGAGAWLNGQPLGQQSPLDLPLRRTIGLVDYKRLPAQLAGRLAAAPPYSSQRSFGSVALDFCWMAAGRGHVYLHGRHNLWDYAAGLNILQEAGGHAVTLEGEQNPPLDLQPRSTAAALDGALFHAWCSYLGITIRQA